MDNIRPAVFQLAQWLGSDTYSFTNEPQCWRIATSVASPVPHSTDALTPRPLLSVNSEPQRGSECVAHMWSSGAVLVGADVFQSLARLRRTDNRRFQDELLPSSWRIAPNRHPAKLLFLGTQLENQWGQRAVLHLRYGTWLPADAQCWLWGVTYLHQPWYPDYLALTLNE